MKNPTEDQGGVTPLQRLGGSILMAAGILIFTLGGLCTGRVIISSLIEGQGQFRYRMAWIAVCLLGGSIPMVAGALTFRAGLELQRNPKRIS